MFSARMIQITPRYAQCFSLSSFVRITTNKYQFSTEPVPKCAGNKPIIIELKQYDSIWWCSCGYSGDQPMCDGSHETQNTGMEPIEFVASETKKYAFCTCKISNKKPLCDGSHKKVTSNQTDQ